MNTSAGALSINNLRQKLVGGCAVLTDCTKQALWNSDELSPSHSCSRKSFIEVYLKHFFHFVKQLNCILNDPSKLASSIKVVLFCKYQAGFPMYKKLGNQNIIALQ